MNSIMLIANPYYAASIRLAPALDARTSVWPDLSRVDSTGRQDHAVAGSQFEALVRAFEHEGDRAINAVEHLLIAVAVRCVSVARSVRPRVTTACFSTQLDHQFLGGGQRLVSRLT